MCAVIPIGDLSCAKSRLSSVLSREERTKFFIAMVKDVLSALSQCNKVQSIMVVTNDGEAASLANSYGALVKPEPEHPGLIQSVTHAAALLEKAYADIMLFLPGDVPLINTEELETVIDGLSQSKASGLVIVPSKDFGGTNCMAISPPSAIDFQFGKDSYRKHIKNARSKGIEPETLTLPGLGMDIDTPEDLMILIRTIGDTNQNLVSSSTFNYLKSSGIAERLTKLSGV